MALHSYIRNLGVLTLLISQTLAGLKRLLAGPSKKKQPFESHHESDDLFLWTPSCFSKGVRMINSVRDLWLELPVYLLALVQ